MGAIIKFYQSYKSSIKVGMDCTPTDDIISKTSYCSNIKVKDFKETTQNEFLNTIYDAYYCQGVWYP